MPQYAIVWHTDHYSDPNVTLYTAKSHDEAITKLEKSYRDTPNDDEDDDEDEDDELYIDAIIEGNDLKVLHDSWG